VGGPFAVPRRPVSLRTVDALSKIWLQHRRACHRVDNYVAAGPDPGRNERSTTVRSARTGLVCVRVGTPRRAGFSTSKQGNSPASVGYVGTQTGILCPHRTSAVTVNMGSSGDPSGGAAGDPAANLTGNINYPGIYTV
jgi:hypothetical protein